MRTIQFVEQIKAGRIRSVLPMIAEKANATYEKLPNNEQVLHSLSDLIQDGIAFTVTSAAYSFNPKKGAKFTTFLYLALDNYYIDRIRAIYRDKRLPPHGVLSLATTRAKGPQGRNISLAKLLANKKYFDAEDKIIRRIDAEREFIRMYRTASPRLRRYMIRWLLQPKSSGRCKPGAEYFAAKKEFKQTVKQPSIPLNLELCDVIQNDYLCRQKVTDAVVRQFYTPKREHKHGFHLSEEFVLAGIASPAVLLSRIPVIGRA